MIMEYKRGFVTLLLASTAAWLIYLGTVGNIALPESTFSKNEMQRYKHAESEPERERKSAKSKEGIIEHTAVLTAAIPHAASSATSFDWSEEWPRVKKR